MDEAKKADHSITVLVVVLTAIVFFLDVMSPLGRATWALYVLPLGLTRWSPLGPLTFIVAAVCSALIVLAHFLCAPGTSPIDIDISNRVFGLLMIWIAAFFLREDGSELHSTAQDARLAWLRIPGSLSSMLPRDADVLRHHRDGLTRKGTELLERGARFFMEEIQVSMPSQDIHGVLHSTRGLSFGWRTEDFLLWTAECEERKPGARKEIVGEAHHLALWPHYFAEMAFFFGTLYAYLLLGNGLMSLVLGFVCLMAALQIEVLRFYSSETPRNLSYVSMAWGLLKWPAFIIAVIALWPQTKFLSIVFVVFLIVQGWLRLITGALSPLRITAAGWVARLLQLDATNMIDVTEAMSLARIIDRWRKEYGLHPRENTRAKPRRKAVGSAH